MTFVWIGLGIVIGTVIGLAIGYGIVCYLFNRY